MAFCGDLRRARELPAEGRLGEREEKAWPQRTQCGRGGGGGEGRSAQRSEAHRRRKQKANRRTGAGEKGAPKGFLRLHLDGSAAQLKGYSLRPGLGSVPSAPSQHSSSSPSPTLSACPQLPSPAPPQSLRHPSIVGRWPFPLFAAAWSVLTPREHDRDRACPSHPPCSLSCFLCCCAISVCQSFLAQYSRTEPRSITRRREVEDARQVLNDRVTRSDEQHAQRQRTQEQGRRRPEVTQDSASERSRFELSVSLCCFASSRFAATSVSTRMLAGRFARTR